MHAPLFQLFSSARTTRKSFLLTTASLAAAAAWSSRSFGAVLASPKLSGYPFTLGVASGDPKPDGVVLWTRLAPEPLDGETGGMPMEPVAVKWLVAEDEKLSRVVQQGETTAVPDWAHSVHVEVEGLQPDRWYWYQFQVGSEASPVGRTRTLPAKGALPQRLRFGVASCQHYESGYYTAYRHLLSDDVDLVFFLGDYLYEKPSTQPKVRSHLNPKLATLAQYRSQYGLYKSDPDLQKIHQQVPFVIAPDDHEVENDYAGAADQLPEQLQLRAAAYKAFYEHTPMRRASLPTGPDMAIYRNLEYGQLANFFVLDTRQYRTLQPKGKTWAEQEAGAMSATSTLLGQPQRDWLFQGLGSSRTQWNVLAQQIMFARLDRIKGPEVGYSMDQWPGYEMDRRAVLQSLREQRIKNPVILTGDIHRNFASEVQIDYEDAPAQPIATEFVATSISSGLDGSRIAPSQEFILPENPFVKFMNQERGYVLCEVTSEQWRTDFRTVPYVTKPDALIVTRASFVVEAGRPELQAV